MAEADETLRKLLGVLFNRHDESAMSVPFLLNNVAEVVLGKSLKSHDGHLAKNVRSLYRLRNEVAPAGRTPDRAPTGPSRRPSVPSSGSIPTPRGSRGDLIDSMRTSTG
jgi:hypothetical protein